MSEELKNPAGVAALAEAKVDSLNDLFTRDPEGLTDADIERLVDELIAQGARFAAAEAAGGGRKKSAVKPPLGAEPISPEQAKLGLDDLGLT